jgi:hypothetical protein
MARTYLSAKGSVVDFDAVMIKQQLAQAPMQIEVERRKKFIDSKEQGVKRPAPPPVPTELPTAVIPDIAYEPEVATAALGKVSEPVPILPERTKKA